ncbi:MAG: HEAT repeat domain-containing protein [Planctomycetota bacterium]
MFGGRSLLLMPVELRFQPVEGRKLIEAVAATRNLKVAWIQSNKCAVLYTGVADIEIERVRNDLALADVTARREAAWRAGWLRDARVVPLLMKAAKDVDVEVARQAIIGLRRATWDTVLALDETAVDLLVADLNSRNVTVRRNAVYALGNVGSERALALIEKAITDQDVNVRHNAISALNSIGGKKALVLIEKMFVDQDANVRVKAVETLGCVGGKKARNALLKQLAAENDRDALIIIYDVLRKSFTDDPTVKKALKNFELPKPAPQLPEPLPNDF